MRKLRLVYAKMWHFGSVAARMDVNDAEEILASSGMTPWESMREAYKSNHLENLAIVDDEDIVYSVGGFSKDGLVWFVVTKEVAEFNLKEKLQVFRLIKQMRDGVLSNVHPVIYNTVYKKNTNHLKLLELLGATFEEVPTDDRFLFFSIEAKEVDIV